MVQCCGLLSSEWSVVKLLVCETNFVNVGECQCKLLYFCRMTCYLSSNTLFTVQYSFAVELSDELKFVSYLFVNFLSEIFC